MTSKSNILNTKKMNSYINEDELDLIDLLSKLSRNKHLLYKFIFSGLVISTIISFGIRKTWQGEFQIVLEENKSQNLLGGIAGGIKMPTSLTELSNLEVNNQTNSLKTEVGILRSPSILMDIFEFVKSEKSIKNKRNLKYKKWKNMFNIELEKGTSILNISYSDKDKELILPVLNKISNSYQDYSGRKRKRTIELGLSNLSKQINTYKSTSLDSLKKVQQFAIDQDLLIPFFAQYIENEDANNGSSSLNIEKIRVKSANEIRFLEKQLEKFPLTGNPEQIMYIASTIPGMRKQAEELRKLDEELSYKRLFYKESDKSIKKLVKYRSYLIELINRQSQGFLEAQKEEAKARMVSAERPVNVLVKYTQLLKDATKNEKTLDFLEAKYRTLSIEQSKYKDPWELITKPTLIPYPKGPRKALIIFIGLIIGFILASIKILLKESKENIIYSIDEMESLTSCLSLGDLQGREIDSWEETIDLLSNGILNNVSSSLSILYIGEIDNLYIEKVRSLFNKTIKNNEILISNDIREVSKSENLIALVALGITSKDEVLEINKKLSMLKKSFHGLLIIQDLNQKK